MPTRAQLVAEVMGWLDRRDLEPYVSGWIASAETEMAELLRARCMVVAAVQTVDAPLISLPADFASMESIRDASSGEMLKLEDHYSGPLQGAGGAASAYRIVGECIEFLPWPTIPDPIQLGWRPQTVRMVWYRAPHPLVDPQDTNAVLEKHYACYLFGTVKWGALFELDDDRAAQASKEFVEAVTAANTWKDTARYSGAPLRSVLPTTVF